MIAVLQFDAASRSLLERLLAEGRLPVLAELQRRGERHALQTPATHFAAGAFHTLYSGVELADHGLFYPFQWAPAEGRVRYMSAFPAPAPVWERLSRRGHRTLAIDPYESRPPRQPPAGTFLSGWQTRDRVVLPRWSSPPDLHRRMTRLLGAPPAVEEVFGRPSVGELLRLRRALLAAPGRVADAAAHLLAREPFDLVWLTYGAAHVGGHHFWDRSQLDPAGADEGERLVLDRTLADIYAAVDAALGRTLERLPADGDVIVVSPVGMEANTSRADLLPGMLEAVLGGGARATDAGGSIWRLRAAAPVGLRARVAAALPDRVALELTARLELRGVDWPRTRAFALPADNQGYVRLNLAGRDRHGIVAPEAAGALMEEIAAGLASFLDPDGAPAVRAVDRTADIVGPGARADLLPDLVVRWSDRPSAALKEVRSPRFGRVARLGAATGRAGNHPEGDAWALVLPGTGRRARRPSRPARLADVAATVAATLTGETLGLPGEPLLEDG